MGPLLKPLYGLKYAQDVGLKIPLGPDLKQLGSAIGLGLKWAWFWEHFWIDYGPNSRACFDGFEVSFKWAEGGLQPLALLGWALAELGQSLCIVSG